MTVEQEIKWNCLCLAAENARAMNRADAYTVVIDAEALHQFMLKEPKAAPSVEKDDIPF